MACFRCLEILQEALPLLDALDSDVGRQVRRLLQSQAMPLRAPAPVPEHPVELLDAVAGALRQLGILDQADLPYDLDALQLSRRVVILAGELRLNEPGFA